MRLNSPTSKCAEFIIFYDFSHTVFEKFVLLKKCVMELTNSNEKLDLISTVFVEYIQTFKGRIGTRKIWENPIFGISISCFKHLPDINLYKKIC